MNKTTDNLFISQNQKETGIIAEKIAKHILSIKNRNNAVVVALEGQLGSGKTTFAKSFAEALGINEVVVSPTFILERIYDLPESSLPFKLFVHIDAYRLDGEKELKKIGWDDLAANPENIIIIEWADRVKKKIPRNAIWIFFEHIDGDVRRVTIT